MDVFYFSCVVPMHVLFAEDGEMEKRTFLATWKDIPVQNEVQYEINDVQHNAGQSFFTGSVIYGYAGKVSSLCLEGLG